MVSLVVIVGPVVVVVPVSFVVSDGDGGHDFHCQHNVWHYHHQFVIAIVINHFVGRNLTRLLLSSFVPLWGNLKFPDR